MDTTTLKAIRAEIELTQEVMADMLQCDPVGYRRYESGGRAIPDYISRSATALLFLHRNKILSKFRKFLLEDLTL